MAVDAEAAGMDAFMDKPFRLEELTAVYIKLMERDQRNQRELSSRETPQAVTSSADIGVVARGPRSSFNVTKNAKIFVDAGDLKSMRASQDGTSPIVAVAVTESERKGKVVNGPDEPVIASGSGSGTNHSSSRVHAAN